MHIFGRAIVPQKVTHGGRQSRLLGCAKILWPMVELRKKQGQWMTERTPGGSLALQGIRGWLTDGRLAGFDGGGVPVNVIFLQQGNRVGDGNGGALRKVGRGWCGIGSRGIPG